MNIPRKYRDDALLERRIKFVFSSNHPLIIDGEDEALIKRIVYLPFNYESRIISKTRIWETKSGPSGTQLLQRHCIMRESAFSATTSSRRFLMWTARSTRL